MGSIEDAEKAREELNNHVLFEKKIVFDKLKIFLVSGLCKGKI
jgi:hypothetical protein